MKRRLAAMAVAVAVGVAGCGQSDSSAAAGYVSTHASDLKQVTITVAAVQNEIGIASAPGADPSSVNDLAMLAQQAHDSFASIHSDLATFGLSNTFGVFGASGELRNSMGALVAYTGNPNPATLASFTTQYQAAVSDWNSSVSALWASAKETSPPPSIATSY